MDVRTGCMHVVVGSVACAGGASGWHEAGAGDSVTASPRCPCNLLINTMCLHCSRCEPACTDEFSLLSPASGLLTL